MKILAIDPGTKCGWACSSGMSGVWDLSVRPDESSGMRLIRLQSKLAEIHKAIGVDVVAFESSRNLRYGRAIAVAGEIQGVLKLFCENNEIQYKPYSSAEIKKFATGKGNSGKDLMVEAARRRFDCEVIDDNHADALWILELARNELSV